jgi:outer membrane protein assembly factor BamB
MNTVTSKKTLIITGTLLIAILITFIMLFTGCAAGDPEPPAPRPPIAIAFDSQDETDIDIDAPLKFTFNTQMNHKSVESAFSIDPHIDGTFSWKTERTFVSFSAESSVSNTQERSGSYKSIMTFTPSSNYEYSTTYTVTISTAAKDLSENHLTLPITWSFITKKSPDTTPPVITANTPTGTGVEINIPAKVRFSKPMNKASAENAFSITPLIAGALSWSGNEMTFTPSSNYAYSTQYEINITTAAKDTSGNSLASPFSWNFTTGEEPDTTPPTVINNTPSGIDAELDTSVSITFSEPMNRPSVENAFSIDPSIEGALGWSGNEMIFTPSLNYDYHTEYTVTVSTAAEDLAGNSMTSSFSWSFTTDAVEGTLKWTYYTAYPVNSSPAVASDGTIYTGSQAGKLYAINPDGTLKWSYTTGDGINESSPAIGSDGTIYIGALDNKLYAINPNGTLKWAYTTGDMISCSSPAVSSDGTVYIGSNDKKLHAVDSNGNLKWVFTTDSTVHSSPAIGEDGTVYIGGNWTDNSLYALNPDNGSIKWIFNTKDYDESGFDEGGAVSSPAIGNDGTIYIGSKEEKKLYAVNPDDGSRKWQNTVPIGGFISSAPVIGEDGTIYIGSEDWKLYAFNPDGTLKWTFLTGFIVQSSPAIGSDGTIYFGSRDNHIYALNPDGTMKWSYETDSTVISSPAIGNTRNIYVGSGDGYLYTIQASSPLAASPWPMFRKNLHRTGRM